MRDLADGLNELDHSLKSLVRWIDASRKTVYWHELSNSMHPYLSEYLLDAEGTGADQYLSRFPGETSANRKLVPHQ